jgi:hypothetical protein
MMTTAETLDAEMKNRANRPMLAQGCVLTATEVITRHLETTRGTVAWHEERRDWLLARPEYRTNAAAWDLEYHTACAAGERLVVAALEALLAEVRQEEEATR